MNFLQLSDYKSASSLFFENGKGTGESQKTRRGFLLTWGNDQYPGYRVWQLNLDRHGPKIKPVMLFESMDFAIGWIEDQEPITRDIFYSPKESQCFI